MYKKCLVVLLPTNQKATNGLQPVSNYSKEGIRLPISLKHLNRLLELGCQAYHLYILSEDEIKVGDHFIHDNSPGLKKWKSVNKCYGIAKNNPGHLLEITPNGGGYVVSGIKTCYKIIASTDSKLGLPSPSPEFLQIYCEKQPKEVLAKYDVGLTKLRLCVTDNIISIKKVKQTYTREEVIAIIHAVKADTWNGPLSEVESFL